MKYHIWIKEVKKIFEEKTGLLTNVFPEEDFKEAFYPDYSPENAVIEELSYWVD